MPAGDLITVDYQYEYNGLLLGANTDYHVQEIDGLTGYPALRGNAVDRFGRHGGVGGRHYLPTREFTVKFDFTPLNDDAFAEQRDAVQEAFSVRTDPTDELPFVFMHPGRNKLQIGARPTAISITTDRLYALKFPQATVRFEATNPLFVDPTLNTVSIFATGDTTGLDFPLDFPLNFGISAANSGSVTNNGTAPAYWTATIYGPATDPHIEEATTGGHVHFTGLVLSTGEFMELDSLNRTALLNGTASRRHLLEPHTIWFQLPPRTTTGIKYNVSGTAGTTTCNFKWQDTYWSD